MASQFFSVIFFCALVSTQCSSQVLRSRTSASVQSGKAFLDSAPSLDITKPNVGYSSSEYTQADASRAVHYNIEGETPLFDSSTGKAHVLSVTTTAFSRDPLPVKSSDIVVLGTITSAEPRFSADRTMLYSKFLFVPGRFLKTTSELPPSKIILDRIGGVAVFPDGKHHFIGADDTGLPIAGHTYLLFLTSTEARGVYQIKTGYCVDGGHVTALDRDGDAWDSKPVTALLSEVATQGR